MERRFPERSGTPAPPRRRINGASRGGPPLVVGFCFAFLLAFIPAAGQETGRADDGSVAASLTSVALRVSRMEAMEAFYREAFGARFRSVQTSGLASRFGEVGGLTLKLVPLREAPDFAGYPVHQLGFVVDDLDRVIQSALRHGGDVESEGRQVGGGRVAAVRDPDGNTLEVVQRRGGGRD